MVSNIMRVLGEQKWLAPRKSCAGVVNLLGNRCCRAIFNFSDQFDHNVFGQNIFLLLKDSSFPWISLNAAVKPKCTSFFSSRTPGKKKQPH